MREPSALLVFLQNAWSPAYAGTTWPRASWLRALARSRSGQRLRIMLDALDVCENTTPQVGPLPDSVCPPDAVHIQHCITQRSPSIIVTCGKQAEHALARLWDGPLLAVPHPAHRLVTNSLYLHARQLLHAQYAARIKLRQCKGFIEEESL